MRRHLMLGVAITMFAIAPYRAADAAKGKARVARAKVYRGLHVDPERYDPTSSAGNMLFRDGKMQRVPIPNIWVHQRLSGAMSYATGHMTPNLARAMGNKPKRAVMLEFELPSRMINWEVKGGERGYFDRNRIPDDRAFLSRIGVVSLRSEKIDWMTPAAFAERYPSAKAKMKRPGS